MNQFKLIATRDEPWGVDLDLRNFWNGPGATGTGGRGSVMFMKSLPGGQYSQPAGASASAAAGRRVSAPVLPAPESANSQMITPTRPSPPRPLSAGYVPSVGDGSPTRLQRWGNPTIGKPTN